MDSMPSCRYICWACRYHPTSSRLPLRKSKSLAGTIHTRFQNWTDLPWGKSDENGQIDASGWSVNYYNFWVTHGASQYSGLLKSFISPDVTVSPSRWHWSTQLRLTFDRDWHSIISRPEFKPGEFPALPEIESGEIRLQVGDYVILGTSCWRYDRIAGIDASEFLRAVCSCIWRSHWWSKPRYVNFWRWTFFVSEHMQITKNMSTLGIRSSGW